ncbi:hypothetical protein J3B02_000316 [Coemansia erecta]|nr:hypothetical protein J3B02_000316 [Coemansia erecta]
MKVQFYTTFEEEDFEKFAQVAKSKDSCHTTIKDLIEHEKNTYRRNSNFQLRNNKGNAIAEGEQFKLMIYNTDLDSIGSDEESDNEVESDFLYVFEDKNLKSTPMICGTVGYGGLFCLKVENDIAYLMNNGGYVCIATDMSYPHIVVTDKVPARDCRIQIHYAEDGNISLSRWDGHPFIYCKWDKASYASINVGADDYTIRWANPVKLIVERV